MNDKKINTFVLIYIVFHHSMILISFLICHSVGSSSPDNRETSGQEVHLKESMTRGELEDDE